MEPDIHKRILHDSSRHHATRRYWARTPAPLPRSPLREIPARTRRSSLDGLREHCSKVLRYDRDCRDRWRPADKQRPAGSRTRRCRLRSVVHGIPLDINTCTRSPGDRKSHRYLHLSSEHMG